jgi:hypothetical protein
MITKNINGLARAVCEVVRPGFVWIIGIIVSVTLGSVYPNYRWEQVALGAILVEFVGFGILVCGNLIYNDVIRFGFLGR